MMSTSLRSETFVLQIGGKQPFQVAAKRYTSENTTPEDGLTLVLAHASGTHKEQWEPMLQRLFSLQSITDSTHRIRAAWAIDAPNHGDSALLNKAILEGGVYSTYIPDSSEALAALISSNHLKGHSTIAIGHSAGSTAFMYSTKLWPVGEIPYLSIILVEPPFIDRDVFKNHNNELQRRTDFLLKAVSGQRSTWDSREAAHQYFTKRLPWSSWDKRVLQAHVLYGLRHVKEDSEEVTTKCDKREEAKSFVLFEPTFRALDQIAIVSRKVPIHVIFGGVPDLVPRYSQVSLIDPSRGRRFASVKTIPDGGHMIVQQKPDVLADCISEILSNIRLASSRL